MKALYNAAIVLAMILFHFIPLASAAISSLMVGVQQSNGVSVVFGELIGDLDTDATELMIRVMDDQAIVSCDRAYYLGISTSGENELVGYKLNASLYPDYLERSEPLRTGHFLTGTPLPLVAVICNAPLAASVRLTLRTSTGTSVSGYSSMDHGMVKPSLCHRISVALSLNQEPTQTSAASASSSGLTAVANVVRSFAEPALSLLNTDRPSFVAHVCTKYAGDSREDEEDNVLVSVILTFSLHLITPKILIPSLEQHLGPLTYENATLLSAQRGGIDFKCASRTGSAYEPPSRDRCRFERCTSPQVLASPISCFFGTTAVFDTECVGKNWPMVPPQRECDVTVADVGVNGFSSSAGAIVNFVVNFGDTTDISQDDFPLITIVFEDVVGFDLSECVTVVASGIDETGLRRHVIDESCQRSRLSFTSNSLSVNISANTTHIFGVEFTSQPEAAAAFNPIFSSVKVLLTRSNKLIFSSSSVPKQPGLNAINPDTEMHELLLQTGIPATKEAMRAFVVVIKGTDLSDAACSLAPAPSHEAVPKDIREQTAPSVVPSEWSYKGNVYALAHFTLAVFENLDLIQYQGSGTFYCRCTFRSTAVVAEVVTTVLTESSLMFGRRFTNLNSPLPIPNGFIGHLIFNHADNADAVTTALAHAFSSPTIPSPNIKVVLKYDEFGEILYSATLKVSPLASFLLPTAEVLQAAFSNITGGAQLVLPGGATSAADVSRTILYSAVEEGVWQCGHDGSYGTCELPAPNCGDSYATPLRCVQSESGTALDPETDPSAAIACGFDEQVLPTLPQSAGCGSFSCRAPDDNVVPCNDARICISGCAVNVTISNDVVAGNSEFRPVCVKDGVVQDDIYCPSTLVSSPSYAPTCNATSTCGTVCFAESTGKRVECTDTASWSECLDTCDGGLSTHFARCADTTVPVGDAAATEVPVSLCPGGVLNVELSTACPVDLSTCPGPTVTVEATSVESEYTITWDDANGKVDVAAQDNALVQLVPVPAEGSAAIVLGTVNATDYEFSFDAVAHNLLPGQYAAVVTLDGVLRGESAPFTILACSPACVNGKCNGISGQCVCGIGFTGEDCSVSLCDVKQCNADTTEECSADTGVAVCKCKGAWSGERCEVSPCNTCSQEGGSCAVTDENTANCKCFTNNDGRPLFYGDNCDIPSNYCETHAPPCYHAGTRAGEFLNGAFVCTDCACTQSWDSATDCKTCGIPCAHGSAPDNECASCRCPIMGGYSGPLCECRNAYMTFIARDKDVDFDAVASAFERVHGGAAGTSPVDQLSLLFATELASVTKIRVVNPTTAVKSMTSPSRVLYYEIALSVGPQCSGFVPVNDEHMISTYERINSLKQFMSAGSHTAKSFVAISTAHVPSGFSANDPNCKLPGDQCPTGWNGNGKHIDADETQDCNGANASDPKCKGSTTKPSSNGLSTGAIAGIAVGGSVALIFIALLLCWVAGVLCFSSAEASNHSSRNSVQMTSV